MGLTKAQSKKSFNKIKSLQSSIIVKLVPEDMQETIRSAIKMNYNLFKEDFEQAIQIGKEIGRKEGRVEGKEIGREIERVVIMEKMRLKGFDENTIQEIIY